VLSKLAVKAKKGTASFKLSAPAQVDIRLAKCVKRTCTQIRALTVSGKKGSNTVRLARKLRAGRYKLTATPAGGIARSAKFKVVVR
jgi:hypothetical protein